MFNVLKSYHPVIFNNKREGQYMYYLLLKCTVVEELSMLHVFKMTVLFV